jgi:histidinol dehydrogenase
MRVITDVEEARKTVLRRGTAPVGQDVTQKMRQLFGRELTVEEAVNQIVKDVRSRGDHALADYSKRLDGIEAAALEIDKRDIREARNRTDPDLLQALEQAAERIREFHLRSRRQSWIAVDEGGVGQWVRPLERVGVYVPGGRAAYPSTLLMTAIPARVAGVTEVFVTTPPSRNGISPSVLAAAEIAEVDRVFAVGGAQAIAALAFGTESIPRVDKICGPGNIFVQLAKRTVFGEVDIDGFYGPTETVILADESANPVLCAADILAQAEHDSLASAILITTSAALASLVNEEIEKQLSALDRREIIVASLAGRGGIVVVPALDEGVALINDYAPEHLSIMTRDPWTWAEQIRNAGGIFIGEDSPEVVGDYVAGPSHVMPTGGTARFSSPVTVDDFLKMTSVVGVNKQTFKKIGRSAAVIARAEGLTAHAAAAELRLTKIQSRKRK